MVVMEGRVIPADRRGSCCFLLGIVTVTFHGASHAGITNKSSLSVLKKHPVSRGRGFDLGAGKVFCSKWLLFLWLDSWVGFDSKHKNYEEIRPAPDTFVPIKDHLPSFLPWQDEKEAARKHLENQVFSSLPLGKKIPLISGAVWRGYDTLLRLLRTPKPKKINKLWR